MVKEGKEVHYSIALSPPPIYHQGGEGPDIPSEPPLKVPTRVNLPILGTQTNKLLST